MKHHYVVRLEKVFKNTSLTVHPPHWQDMINNRSVLIETFFPAFDALFNEYHFKFWLAKEYGRNTKDTWTEEELFTGLDCFYRIILQDDYEVPDILLEKIRQLPHIADVRELKIAESSLPVKQISTQASVMAKAPGDLIYLPYTRPFTKGNQAVNIAVLDTGVNPQHRELKGRIKKYVDFVNLQGLDTSAFLADEKQYGYPVDAVGHGTHVAGILAAEGINMEEGICPGCNILAVRVLATMRSGNKLVGAGIVDNINTGIKWAVDNGADIINMSLGIKHTGGGLPHEEIVQYALRKNVTIVAASGNDGTEEKYYPGALPGVIAVGAVDNTGYVTNFTSFGANITVVAPGLNIYSSFTQGGYAFASGTSQASPFVTGSIGLLKSYALEKGRRMGNEEIKYILKSTADKTDSHLRSQRGGYGLINLADAFKLLNHISR